MFRLTPLALIGLLTCTAAATPAAPTGEWLLGPAYPAAVYEGVYSEAKTDTARLLLRPDGHYALTDIEFTYVPGYFGSYLVTCGSLTVTTEMGRYEFSGDQVTFRPDQASRMTGLSPQALNAGCKRSEGFSQTLTTEPYRGTATLKGAQLSVSVNSAQRNYLSRAAAETASQAPVPAPTPAPSTAAPETVVKSQPWTATRDWEAVLELVGKRLPMLFHLYDDGESSLSGSGVVGGENVAWLLGSRNTFDIGLSDGPTELKLKVQGQFRGDTFEGTFRVLNEDGEFLVSGVLKMQRP